jgi:hypothetical protein
MRWPRAHFAGGVLLRLHGAQPPDDLDRIREPGRRQALMMKPDMWNIRLTHHRRTAARRQNCFSFSSVMR